MNVIGKPTINPVLFYTGKMSGYITWVLSLLSIFAIIDIRQFPLDILRIPAYIVAAVALMITTVSMFNLGKSTRLGLPSERTEFRKKGLYGISRNPMYLGFNLLTLAAMALTVNAVTALMGVYSMIVYHLIIRGEEIFLENRFGEQYLAYKKKVRRYL